MRAALLLFLLLAGSANAAEWQKTQEKGGVTYEQRAVDGSKYLEYRADIERVRARLK